MKKILVTGFTAFQNETVNPSQKIVDNLNESIFNSKLDGSVLDLTTATLPVSFEGAKNELLQILEKNHFEKIFLLGQAGGRKQISLERLAINWIETKISDEDKVTPRTGPIDLTKAPSYFSTANLENLKTKLESAKIPVEISLSAGGFVCNALYFHCLSYLKNTPTEVVFVHLPYLPEQILNKPSGTFSMPLQTQVESIKILLSE